MAIGKTNAGAGGSGGVNFRVVGGLTQPTAPKGNTIWVPTDVDIPFWTTAASSKTPDYVAPAGTVTFWWESATNTEVSGTTAAGFMPVKEKATNPPGYMRIKPINCFQNQDGTAAGWKSMDAYIYKGGEWVQFGYKRFEIFANGKFGNNIQFVCNGNIKYSNDYSGVAPTQSVSGGLWEIHMAKKSGASGCVISTSPIDFTGIDRVVTNVVSGISEDNPDTYRALYVGLYKSNGSQLYTEATAITYKYYPIDNADLILDTSEISGEYYLAVFIHGWNHEIDVSISGMYGE